MSKDSKRKAAVLRKVARVLRAWGELYGAAKSPEAREAALSSPEGREAARTALDLATRHFRTIMAASNRWGCDKSARLAVHLLQEFTAERGRTDLGKYWYQCHAFTQPRQPGEMALPDELDRWADEFEKAETVPEPLQVTYEKGRVYDVWHAVESILWSARDHVWLEDPFINGEVVGLLGSLPEHLPVRVLTKKFYDGADASLRKLGKQRSGRLEVKATGEIHGRRLFVDHRVWETSESIKDLAFKTASTVKEIDSPVDAAKLRDCFEARWKAAQRHCCNDKGNEA